MDKFKTTQIGNTGLKAGQLGLAASYGAPAEAFEYAFERGCNYFYMGGGRKRAQMKKAIKNLTANGQRDNMIIAIQTYARLGLLTEFFFRQTLKSLGIEYADIMILGWHNRTPFSMLMDFAFSMREKGLCRFIGMSGHNRPLFREMNSREIEGRKVFDLFHIRYNAAHRGAETDCFPHFEADSGPGVITYTATRWGHLLDPKRMPGDQLPLRARDCYRFVLSNPYVNVCLCGPENMSQMEEALTALEYGPMDSDEIKHAVAVGDHIHQNAHSFFS